MQMALHTRDYLKLLSTLAITDQKVELCAKVLRPIFQITKIKELKELLVNLIFIASKSMDLIWWFCIRPKSSSAVEIRFWYMWYMYIKIEDQSNGSKKLNTLELQWTKTLHGMSNIRT